MLKKLSCWIASLDRGQDIMNSQELINLSKDNILGCSCHPLGSILCINIESGII